MLKNVSWLFVASVFGQLIQFVMQPLLANVYDLEAFRLFGEVVSLATILVVFATSQLQTCIVLLDEEKRAPALVVGLLWLSAWVFFGGVASLLWFWLMGFSVEDMEKLFWISSAVLVIGSANLISGYYSGVGAFRVSAKFNFARAVFVPMGQFFIGASFKHSGLLIGYLLGESLVRLIFFKTYYYRALRKVKEAAKCIWLEYRKFCFAGTIQESVSVLVLMTPLYFFSTQFGSAIGGSYAFAFKISWAPSVLIATSVSAVLLKVLADSRGDCDFGFLKNLSQAIVVFIVVLVGYVIILVPILELVLEEKWLESIDMISVVSVWVSAYLASLKVRQMYRVYGLQLWQLMVEIFVFVIVLTVFKIADGWREALYLSTAVGVFQNIAIFLLFFVAIKNFKLKAKVEK